MAGTNELATEGLVIGADGVECSKDVVVQEDLNVQEIATIGEDVAIGGDLYIDGVLTETAGVKNVYVLQIQALDVSGANNGFAVVPVAGNGEVIGVHFVATTALTTASAIITLTTGEGASAPTMTLTTAAMGSIGDSMSFDLTAATNTGVAAGENIRLTSDGGPGAGIVNAVIVIAQA